MARGPYWTNDEERILKYMWEVKDPAQSEGEFATEVSRVLKTRDANAIDIHRRQMGLTTRRVIKVEKVEIVKTISPPKHSDSLPEYSAQINDVRNQIVVTQNILDSIFSELKSQTELWRTIDARRKDTTNE